MWYTCLSSVCDCSGAEEDDLLLRSDGQNPCVPHIAKPPEGEIARHGKAHKKGSTQNRETSQLSVRSEEREYQTGIQEFGARDDELAVHAGLRCLGGKAQLVESCRGTWG